MPPPRCFAGLVALAGAPAAGPPDRVFPVFFTDFSADLDGPAIAVVASAAPIAKQFPRGRCRSAATPTASDRPQRRSRCPSAGRRRGRPAGAGWRDPSRITRDAVGTPPNSQPGVERRRVEIDIGT